jgi:acetyltransferase-like isoleucine patch superfamily enzyme
MLYCFGSLNLNKNIEMERRCDIFVGSKGILDIGENDYFNIGVIISCHNKIHIGQNSLFGPNVMIFDNNHMFSKATGVSTSDHSFGEIIIGNNCWIGANCVILKGTILGDNCIVGAGTILKGQFKDGTIITSNRELSIKEIL